MCQIRTRLLPCCPSLKFRTAPNIQPICHFRMTVKSLYVLYSIFLSLQSLSVNLIVKLSVCFQTFHILRHANMQQIHIYSASTHSSSTFQFWYIVHLLSTRSKDHPSLLSFWQYLKGHLFSFTRIYLSKTGTFSILVLEPNFPMFLLYLCCSTVKNHNAF